MAIYPLKSYTSLSVRHREDGPLPFSRTPFFLVGGGTLGPLIFPTLALEG